MKNEARLTLSRINQRECFVLPETTDFFVAQLMQFAETDPKNGPELEDAVFASVECAYDFTHSDRENRKPFIYQDGMAIIPIHGTLLNRFGGSWGFVTGYQAIRRQMNAALEDDDVEMLIFDVDSPGGEAAGCLELADEIRASREIKPSLAFVDALSASAGYALGSAATRIKATPSSKIGSIGTMAMHVDLSGALDQAGIKITLMEAPEGGMKTAGSPFKPLDRRAEREFQSSINKSYENFVETVVANRGISADAVRETEARVFRAEEALALNLIDEVNTSAEAVSSFMAELAGDDSLDDGDDEMSTQAKKPEATSETDQTAAIQAAVTADRERMAAIKALPEAANRPKLAETLALDGYTVEQSKKLLASAAEEKSEAPAEEPKKPETTAETPKQPEGEQKPKADEENHFEKTMEQSKHPEVGSGGDKSKSGSGSGQEPSGAELVSSILADQAAACGVNHGEKQKADA